MMTKSLSVLLLLSWFLGHNNLIGNPYTHSDINLSIGNCTIGELILDPAQCTGENTYSLYLNFEHENAPNDLFDVYGIDNVHVGTYQLSQLPIIIENFEGSGHDWDYIKVAINDNPDCNQTAEFQAPDCPGDCAIGELSLDPAQCTGENTYSLYLNFEYENAPNELFDVYGIDNVHVGTYKLSDLPIIIENFPSNNQGYDYIRVCINDNPNCCKEAEFEAPLCPGECAIGELILDPAPCTGENTYSLYLNFEYENAPNDLFDVYGIDNVHVGTYQLSQLPIIIENFEGSGHDWDYIKVAINDNPDCNQTAEFQAPDCPAECAIGDLILDPANCTGENTYSLYLNFEYENAPNDLFEVYGIDNAFVGTYHLSNLPIIIENFEGSGHDWDYIKVAINDNPDCYQTAEFQAPDCPGECAIGELILDPAPCTGENTYNLYLNFEHENVTNEFFDVYTIGDTHIGTYKLSDLPIIIENFPSNNQGYDYIRVCINDNPDCCKEAEFEAPLCPAECAIGELSLDPAQCTGENTYSLYLNFEYENAPNDLFDVYGIDNVHVGTYQLSQLPIIIENFEGSGHDWDYIKVAINDNPDCYQTAEFQAPDCPGDCAIGELILDPANCTGENTYSLYLNFEYENAPNDLFDVYGIDNVHVGTYQLSQLPIIIENFEGSGHDWDYIKVAINDNPDCNQTAEFQAPDCPGECTIGELILDPAQCTGENTYSLYLNFEYENAPNDLFDVFGIDNVHVGTYQLSQLPIKIEDFEGSGHDWDYIKVAINDNPDCYQTAEFQAPDCPGDCVIGELILDPAQCTGENTYSLYLNFEYENAPNDLFDVYGIDNVHVGTYQLSQLPIIIENFEGSGHDWDYIKVAINDNPDCYQTAEFQAPDCPGDCTIGELILDPAQCTGENTYSLYLNFEYENAPNDLFDVYGIDNAYVGTYHLSNLPIIIENFEGSGHDWDYIKVAINDNPDCYQTAEFQAPDCPGECTIGELILDPANCTGENTYSLYLNFEHENVSNEFFDVYTIGDTHIGTYKLSDLPIIIENFPSNNQGYDYIRVCINDNPDCCKEAEFEAPLCPGECAIGELILDPANCTGENTYSLYLNFEYENAPNDLFEVYGIDNAFVGTYHLSNLPIIIENFEGSGHDWDYIKVTINDNPDCYQTAEFQAPYCVTDSLYDDKSILTSTDIEIDKSAIIQLGQNYPNPFKDKTTIPFELARNTEVKLSLFNILGQPIEVIIDTNLPAGKHKIVYDSRNIMPGIYYYKLTVENYQITKTMVLTK